MIIELYFVREVRIYLRRIKDFFSINFYVNVYFVIDYFFLFFLFVVVGVDVEGKFMWFWIDYFIENLIYVC